ncbi:DUF5959 family protein [Streptomyces sp. URMC 123]|uniref:DUF5959 family protein n=1 Tax=Streptomyces sp. URMC 123 TaxID=3423403 RepID=UPI003F1A148F
MAGLAGEVLLVTERTGPLLSVGISGANLPASRAEGYTVDLINLSDGDNGFRVRVLGRRSPGVPHLHDQLDAEALITSSFVSGRLAMSLFPPDLEDWSRALDLLDAGQDICWRDNDHSPVIRIQPCNEEHDTPAVPVEDPSSSCVSVSFP